MAAKPVIELDPKRIDEYIRNATVKIYIDETFVGTGFFISSTGYVLTAHHCINAPLNNIQIETPHDGKIQARIDPAKSLPGYDMAILTTEHRPTFYIPLGKITREQISDEVVAIGYPASHYISNKEVGVYKGHLSRWRDDDRVELSDAIKGRGQSGGSIYHYKTRRVVGVVTDRYKPEEMVDVGMAMRLDRLFNKWPELRELNQLTAEEWDRKLQQEPLLIPYKERRFLIVLFIAPHKRNHENLLNALRNIFENQMGCEVLTIEGKKYKPSHRDNTHHHLDKADVFVAEVSKPRDEDAMYVTILAQQYHDRPLILLSKQENPGLSRNWQGTDVIKYDPDANIAELEESLDESFSKLEILRNLLDSEREHFLPVSEIEEITGLKLTKQERRKIQKHYPTREAWKIACIEDLNTLFKEQPNEFRLLLRKMISDWDPIGASDINNFSAEQKDVEDVTNGDTDLDVSMELLLDNSGRRY
jgi:Trypsin-like peptidase domain